MDIAIELQANPQYIIVEGDEKRMHDYLSNALRAWLDCGIQGATFRVNNVVPQRYDGFAMEKVNLYIRTARKVIDELCG